MLPTQQPQQGFGQPTQGFGQPQQGYGQQPGKLPLPYGQGPQRFGQFSPKRRDSVMLLCFFFGTFGVHRFYLGKIVTGILMVLTLGGLGIWTVVDFYISAWGRYKDSKGLYVDKHSTNWIRVVGSILVTLFGLSIYALFIIHLSAFSYYFDF
jgi:TM2 domain-containing membrane protein YozV